MYIGEMRHHYLLWASGPDQSGIVSTVTKVLFDRGMNLEDSSMMRLGSEFGIFLIFTADGPIQLAALETALASVGRRLRLSLGIKKISAREAQARRARSAFLVSVHGPDRPGIVSRVTAVLAKRRFNITDLSTHRTTSGKNPGYILFIEGEPKSGASVASIRNDLRRIQQGLKTKVDVRPIVSESL